VRFELCGYPYERTVSSTIVRVDARGRRTLAGPASKDTMDRPTGHWRSVALSPRGDRLLAQWSGECEIPTGYVVDARTGRATSPDGDAESLTLGWTGRTALVALLQGACGAGAERAGVYAVDPSGRARLIRAFAKRHARAAYWR
jgi:hypothetical protein